MQSLMAALKSQEAGTTASGATPSTGAASASGGPGRFAADVKSLLQSLSGTSSGSTTATSSSGTSTAASTATTADSSLQTSFNTLMADLGGSGGAASLTNFLQSFSTNMQANSPLGNLVDSTA